MPHGRSDVTHRWVTECTECAISRARLAANLAMGVPAIRAARVRMGRTTGASPDDKAREILAQFLFFTGTIGPDELRGKTVLEIGPGDAIPLAPLFLGAGAARYVALDRFLGEVVGGDASACSTRRRCGERRRTS